jgi:CheY-like chemotaxis protein
MRDERSYDKVGRPTVQLLIIDDSQDDALLLARDLQRVGYGVRFEWASGADAVRKAFQAPGWDLILCDYAMPGFDVWAVLQLYGQLRMQAPLIVVSGVVGEYIAPKIESEGARDYIRKGDSARLADAVARVTGIQPESASRQKGTAGPARARRNPALSERTGH